MSRQTLGFFAQQGVITINSFRTATGFFPVKLRVATGPMSEFYGLFNALKVRGRIHLLIHDSTIKEVLPLLYTSFINSRAIRRKSLLKCHKISRNDRAFLRRKFCTNLLSKTAASLFLQKHSFLENK